MDTEPDIFFIVPYRDREAHLEIFINHMKIILDEINYMILISHQCDTRLFNRGGLKNLGFLWIKKKYPNTYKEKTLVFHDVDNLYYRKNILNWKTTHGKIKHFFGIEQKKSKSLGGILSVTGSDFEKMNGFPNYWSWGYEDNALYYRAKYANIKIDYSQFNRMGCKYVVVFWHGDKREVAEEETWDNYTKEMKNKKGYGLSHVTNIKQKLLKITDKIFYLQNLNFDVPDKKPKKIQKKMPSQSFKNSKRENNLKNYKNLFKNINF